VWSVKTYLLLCPDACSSDVRTVQWHFRTRMVLLIANLAVNRPDKCVPRPDMFFSGILFATWFLCHSHYTAVFSYFVMLWVFLADFSRDFGILCTSPFHGFWCVFLCSFKVLVLLKYWNIFLRYCAWKSFFVYVLGGYLYICAIWIAIFAFLILANTIDNCYNITFFMDLTGTNISLWCYFWIDLC
jgi:hypothetical protein